MSDHFNYNSDTQTVYLLSNLRELLKDISLYLNPNGYYLAHYFIVRFWTLKFEYGIENKYYWKNFEKLLYVLEILILCRILLAHTCHYNFNY